jgi:MFS family permease
MVAEVVPEHRRVEAGALLYTSAPIGLFLATQVTWFVQGVAMVGQPETSWRVVFLMGLIPAAVALVVRVFVKEPERWQATGGAVPAMSELFANPHIRARTLSGLLMAITALTMWWSVNAFLPVVASGLAEVEAGARGLSPDATSALKESWKALTTNVFNIGGLVGTLLTVPIAKRWGRRPMFGLYFAASAAAILLAFGLDVPPGVRLWGYLPIGLSVFGVFGAFTYYLPELFPTRLRGTGAGFCYNAGRVFTAAGPFLVGWVASRQADALSTALDLLFWVGLVPLVGLLLLPLVVETRDQVLQD